jgi:uncharacterized LabA/DUF88 family protein
MHQIAVFVDAGYLHAQGSALLAGSAQRREQNRLNVPILLENLIDEAKAIEPIARLLRIYWYDGVARGGVLSVEQKTLARSDNVKCRFGVINSKGQQKGIDSLIVTDLIQLAREQACSDALILSGDEDLRVGVQVAQTFGIRVHVLGIHPARGSQSPDLLAEADTTREWGAEKVGAWLTIAPPAIDPAAAARPVAIPTSDAVDEGLATLALALVADLEPEAAVSLLDHVDRNRNQLAPDFDRPSLARARDLLGRDLTFNERSEFREAVRNALRTRNSGTDAK